MVRDVIISLLILYEIIQNRPLMHQYSDPPSDGLSCLASFRELLQGPFAMPFLHLQCPQNACLSIQILSLEKGKCSQGERFSEDSLTSLKQNLCCIGTTSGG